MAGPTVGAGQPPQQQPPNQGAPKAVVPATQSVIVQGTPVSVDTGPPKSNETVPGGRYIVRGVAVDADGEPHKDKVTAEELKASPPPVVPKENPGPGQKAT